MDGRGIGRDLFAIADMVQVGSLREEGTCVFFFPTQVCVRLCHQKLGGGKGIYSELVVVDVAGAARDRRQLEDRSRGTSSLRRQ